MTAPTVLEGKSVDVTPATEPTRLPSGPPTVTREELERKALMPVAPPSQTGILQVTTQQLQTISSALGVSLNASELALFAEVANRSGLDPFAKQIYAIKRGGKLGFQTGIDGYRSIAERTGQYDGSGPVVLGPACTCEGEINQCRLDDGRTPYHPEWAEMPVYRKDHSRPQVARAYWHEYWPGPGEEVTKWGRTADNKPYPLETKPKTGRNRDDSMWLKMPRVMLPKVSEALGLRQAFPYVYGGLYTDTEMDQAGPSFVDNQPAGPRDVTDRDHEQVQPSAEPLPQGVWEGTLTKRDPEDGIRRATRPDWAPAWLEPGKTVPKVELVLEIERRKFTVLLLGDVAKQVSDAPPGEGDLVRVEGAEYYEHTWQEGKPKQKQLRAPTKVQVLRGDDWVTIAEHKAGQEGPKASSSVSAPSDTAASPKPTTPSGPTGEAKPTPDPAAAAKAVFPDAVVLQTGEPNAPADIEGRLELLRWDKTPGDVQFVRAHVADGGRLWQVGFLEPQWPLILEPSQGPDTIWRFEVGSIVGVKGTWVTAKVILPTEIVEVELAPSASPADEGPSTFEGM